MEEPRETIREIKKELRLFMNGVTSAQLRKLGMEYNIIFGVDIPHLKEIASKFPKNAALAKALWKENIRESKLLAIYLLPEENYSEVAEEWIGECRYTENADHLSHKILCRLPDAIEKAMIWSRYEKELYSYCGYSTLAHLFRGGNTLSEAQENELFSATSALIDTLPQNKVTTQAIKAITLYCDDEEDIIARFNAIHGKTII